MKRTTLGLLLFIVIIMTGCATPLTKEELSAVKNIGIQNNFPAKPNFTNVGTTMFNNTYETVDDDSYFEAMTQEVMQTLEAKGYNVVVLSEAHSSTPVDMVIDIQPRGLYDIVDTHGYGFYDKSFFSKSVYRKSYVALNLTPQLNGTAKCESCYGESATDLSIED